MRFAFAAEHQASHAVVRLGDERAPGRHPDNEIRRREREVFDGELLPGIQDETNQSIDGVQFLERDELGPIGRTGTLAGRERPGRDAAAAIVADEDLGEDLPVTVFDRPARAFAERGGGDVAALDGAGEAGAVLDAERRRGEAGEIFRAS